MSVAYAIGRAAKNAANGFVNLLMPPTCIACKGPVASALGYCAKCWAALPVNSGATCHQCATPLPQSYQTETLCLGCVNEPPPYDATTAPYLYDGPVRPALLSFKHGRETYARTLGGAMARSLRESLTPDTLVVPVPLHRLRMALRGYNQSLLLARVIAKEKGGLLQPDLLRRVKATASTKGMTRKQRLRNVVGAFRICPGGAPRLKGAEVLLVDDVMTTGATAAACARVLKRAGASRVRLVVYARVATSASTQYLELNPYQDHHAQG